MYEPLWRFVRARSFRTRPLLLGEEHAYERKLCRLHHSIPLQVVIQHHIQYTMNSNRKRKPVIMIPDCACVYWQLSRHVASCHVEYLHASTVTPWNKEKPQNNDRDCFTMFMSSAILTDCQQRLVHSPVLGGERRTHLDDERCGSDAVQQTEKNEPQLRVGLLPQT